MYGEHANLTLETKSTVWLVSSAFPYTLVGQEQFMTIPRIVLAHSTCDPTILFHHLLRGQGDKCRDVQTGKHNQAHTASTMHYQFAWLYHIADGCVPDFCVNSWPNGNRKIEYPHLLLKDVCKWEMDELWKDNLKEVIFGCTKWLLTALNSFWPYKVASDNSNWIMAIQSGF